jgi:LysM repeat protein
MPRGRREGWARVAAPIAFLAAVTIAVLLVRSGLHAGGTTTTSLVPTVATRSTPTGTRRKPKRVVKQFYTVQSGDTFGSIAAKYHISVARLEQLNPGVSSNALVVGQKIRVK